MLHENLAFTGIPVSQLRVGSLVASAYWDYFFIVDRLEKSQRKYEYSFTLTLRENDVATLTYRLTFMNITKRLKVQVYNSFL